MDVLDCDSCHDCARAEIEFPNPQTPLIMVKSYCTIQFVMDCFWYKQPHLKKCTFADNLLTPMSSKMSMSFFLQSKQNEGF